MYMIIYIIIYKKLDLKIISGVKNIFALDPTMLLNLKCDNVSVSDISLKIIRIIIRISFRYIKIRLR